VKVPYWKDEVITLEFPYTTITLVDYKQHFAAHFDGILVYATYRGNPDGCVTRDRRLTDEQVTQLEERARAMGWKPEKDEEG
jgi:hypothetical protein